MVSTLTQCRTRKCHSARALILHDSQMPITNIVARLYGTSSHHPALALHNMITIATTKSVKAIATQICKLQTITELLGINPCLWNWTCDVHPLIHYLRSWPSYTVLANVYGNFVQLPRLSTNTGILVKHIELGTGSPQIYVQIC